ncbi:MAG: hypothetical protein P8166_05030 [Candidatus Thiodiazotropha sp.]
MLTLSPIANCTVRAKPTRAWLLLLVLSLHSLSLIAEELQMFELKGATPQELIPLIKPFVGPDGTVTGMHNQLIVRTTTERMVQVRRILQQFDRAPRRLLLSVRDRAPGEAEMDRMELSVEHPHLQIGEGRENSLRLKRYTTDTQETNLRTLQTLEGQPTLITSGVSRPLVSGRGYIVGPRAREWTNYDYQTIASGFYATVRLLGDRIRIEITSQKQTPIDGSAAISHQETDSVVSGRLGEWLPLASSASQSRLSSRGIGGSTGSETSRESELWVKVELLPE